MRNGGIFKNYTIYVARKLEYVRKLPKKFNNFFEQYPITIGSRIFHFYLNLADALDESLVNNITISQCYKYQQSC